MSAVAMLGLLLAPSCTLNRFGTLEVEPVVASGECEEPDDCPGRFLDCRAPTCENTNCGTYNAPVGTACDDDGGNVCNGAGRCVECIDASQCEPGEICQADLCVPASCGDGRQNNGETDVDCGGPCAPCADGQGCGDASDCVSGYCANGICAPCTVSEDCQDTHWCDAGICVPKNQPGDVCNDPVQCLSGFCPEDGVCCNQACVDTCMACIAGYTGLDSGQCGVVIDGEDPDAECLDQGEASCGSDGYGCYQGACRLYDATTVCVPVSCTNGVRRWKLCTGTGECDQVEQTEDCSPYQCVGTDCRSGCSDDSHCLSGSYCDGGICRSKGELGNPCSAPNECKSGFCVDARCCESACTGTCKACSQSKTGIPAPPAQDAGLCRSILTSTDPDDECTQGACYRINDTTGECRYYLGHTCDGSTVRCLARPCVDGYCCENNCTDFCKSCDGSETIGSNGYCRPITSDTDPDGECLDDGAQSCDSNGDGCDGAGQCILYPAATVCQSASCASAVRQPPDYCNGSGDCINTASENCSPYVCNGSDCRTSCSDIAHCVSGYYCDTNNGQCVSQGGVGDPCTGDVQCSNDQCVDGYCCGSACTGFCRSCAGSETGGSNGQCGDISSGQDPDSECPDGTCDGSGACTLGTNCSSPTVVCTGDDHCVDGRCCNSACNGTCEACRGDWTTGSDGTCSPITAGEDYDDECPEFGGSGGSGGGSGAGGGGGLLGTCDGSRACQ